MEKLQIIDWNFSCFGYNKRKIEFLFSKAKENCCILLQEIKPEVYEYIKNNYSGKYNFVYSLDYRKPGIFDSEARKLGVLIACSKSVEILNSGVVERNIFPDRTAFATIKYCGIVLKFLVIHSLTGCGYYKAKSIQYESLSEFVREYNPDVIGIDANEPEVDSYDIDKMKFFENGYGAACFFREVRNCGLVDSFVKANKITECSDGECLAVSCKVRRRGLVRYDFIFVNNKIDTEHCEYLYDSSVEAGSDHAMIEAEILI